MWKKFHTTPYICVPITNPRRNTLSNHDQQARYRLQCSVLDSFHSEIQGPVFLTVGPDAKLDMLKTFDLDKPFNLHLDSTSSENPPICRITQDGKDPIITTDFYLTNVEPREWILLTPPTNNKTATSNAAAAASNSTPVIPDDPLQPGEIRLHSWQLYTPEAPVLDLRGKKVTSMLDLADVFHELHFCPTDDNQQEESSPNGKRKSQKPKNPNNQLSNSDTSDEEPINPILKTSVEERHYGTIPSLALATQAALSHSRAQANPTVESRSSHMVRVKKLPKEKATDKSTQTDKQKK